MYSVTEIESMRGFIKEAEGESCFFYREDCCDNSVQVSVQIIPML